MKQPSHTIITATPSSPLPSLPQKQLSSACSLPFLHHRRITCIAGICKNSIWFVFPSHKIIWSPFLIITLYVGLARPKKMPITQATDKIEKFANSFTVNFTFALVPCRKLSTNYLQNLVLSIQLNFGYFSTAFFWRKIVLPLAIGSFSKFLLKKPKIICCTSNKLEWRRLLPIWWTTILVFTRYKFRKNKKKPNFGAKFSNIFAWHIIRKMNGRSGLVSGTLTEHPSDILTRMERPLNIWSTVTFVPSDILAPSCNIQRFYIQPPLKLTLCYLWNQVHLSFLNCDISSTFSCSIVG